MNAGGKAQVVEGKHHAKGQCDTLSEHRKHCAKAGPSWSADPYGLRE
jgi:hypothetical protein